MKFLVYFLKFFLYRGFLHTHGKPMKNNESFDPPSLSHNIQPLSVDFGAEQRRLALIRPHQQHTASSHQTQSLKNPLRLTFLYILL